MCCIATPRVSDSLWQSESGVADQRDADDRKVLPLRWKHILTLAIYEYSACWGT